MATPNLINVDTITPSVAVGAVTTSRVDIVDVTAEYCAKINSLIIANIDGTNAATVTVEVSTDNGSNYTKIANTVRNYHYVQRSDGIRCCHRRWRTIRTFNCN